jgi:hypothetical protein
LREVIEGEFFLRGSGATNGDEDSRKASRSVIVACGRYFRKKKLLILKKNTNLKTISSVLLLFIARNTHLE